MNTETTSQNQAPQVWVALLHNEDGASVLVASHDRDTAVAAAEAEVEASGHADEYDGSLSNNDADEWGDLEFTVSVQATELH